MCALLLRPPATITLELNAGGSLPTNDPGILKDTKTQLKLKLSTATAAANNVIQLSQTGSGGCTYCATLGGTYQATLTIAFGSGEDTKTAIYVQCATAHATGSQLVATKTAGDDAYDTLTTPAMAVATTLSGSTSDITVTKHNDAALPTDDPGILKDFETQLKITLTTASVGTTTVSMSMSNTNGGCQFSTTSGSGYGTTKNVAISNGVDVTTGIYVKCATGHATGGSIIATVSVTSVNSYNTLTHTAMAVATTLSGSVTVKQSNNNALATNAPGDPQGRVPPTQGGPSGWGVHGNNYCHSQSQWGERKLQVRGVGWWRSCYVPLRHIFERGFYVYGSMGDVRRGPCDGGNHIWYASVKFPC